MTKKSYSSEGVMSFYEVSEKIATKYDRIKTLEK